MKIFQFENNSLKINQEEILLIKEFANLWTLKRNKQSGDKDGRKRLKAYSEFTYIYLTTDWKSPYARYSESERKKAALIDSGLKASDIDSEVIAAIRKYEELQNTETLKLLKSAYIAIDKLRMFFEDIDLQETDDMGRIVHDSAKLVRNLQGLGELVKSVKSLEDQVKKEMDEDSGIRGDNERGRL